MSSTRTSWHLENHPRDPRKLSVKSYIEQAKTVTQLVAAFLCLCIARSLGSTLPLGAAFGQKAALGVGKVGEGAAKVGDQLRDASQGAHAARDYENNDIKKAVVARDWNQNSRRGSSDANAAAQAHAKDAAAWHEQKDASHRAAAKSSAQTADKSGNQVFGARNNFDKNQNWANNEGWRKGNRRHEGISYAFDKNFRRNENENGGFDAGSKLADHALDDFIDKSSSYDRRIGDHNAHAANADRQEAGRNAGFQNGAFARRANRDKFGRDANQKAAANSNNRDWAEKRDNSANANLYNEDQYGRAFDTLNDHAALDRNANRKTNGFKAASDAKKVAGTELGYGAPYGYGVAGKVGAIAGKDFDAKTSASDRSNVWDAAKRNKNQKWAAAESVDRNKDSRLANQWQQDKVKGFDTDKAAAHHDHGFAADRRNQDEGNHAANSQWAAANAAKASAQNRHDLDEEKHLRANNKWKQQDRDHKYDEYKKFFNNDQKGGQNWERLKYNRAQTDDAAAADFKVAKDNAALWRDANRFDDANKRQRGTENARARHAQNRHWSEDGRQNANGHQAQQAAAADRANKGVWGADDDRRKYAVEQLYRDQKASNANARNQGTQRAGYDNKVIGKNAFGAAGAAGFPAYNYGGYPSYGGYGYGNYGGYGNPAGYGYGNYGNYGNYGYPGRGYVGNYYY